MGPATQTCLEKQTSTLTPDMRSYVIPCEYSSIPDHGPQPGQPSTMLQQAKMALSRGNLDSVRMLSLTFHRLICALTRNPVIIFTLNSVLDVLEENVLKIKLDREFVHNEIIEHAAIIEKIKVRNPEASRQEMHKHIQRVHEKLETAHAALVAKKHKGGAL